MTTQINIRLDESFLERVKEYTKLKGFLNVQEFFREAAREKIFDDAEIKEKYLEKLKSIQANKYLSKDEAKLFEKELEKRAKLE